MNGAAIQTNESKMVTFDILSLKILVERRFDISNLDDKQADFNVYTCNQYVCINGMS